MEKLPFNLEILFRRCSGRHRVPFSQIAAQTTAPALQRKPPQTERSSSLCARLDLARVAALATESELAGTAAAVDYAEAHIFEFNDASKGLAIEPA